MDMQYNLSPDDPLFQPIYLGEIDPKFTSVEKFEGSLAEVFRKMKRFEIELYYVRAETPRIRKYVKSTTRSSKPTRGGRNVYRCRHYSKSWVRITNNSRPTYGVPELIDFNRQNFIRTDIAQTNKRLYREAVDKNWDGAVKKVCRFRNSLGRNDQCIAESNAFISWIEDHIKEFEHLMPGKNRYCGKVWCNIMSNHCSNL